MPEELKSIAIIGMGPGGLAAAIEAARKGHPVTVFENRLFFIRPQKIFPDGKTTQFLNSLITSKEDEEKVQAISDTGDKGVRVRTIQKFLYRKLLEMQKEAPDRVHLVRDSSLQLDQLDSAKQTLKYTVQDQEHTLAFAHLIEADGAGRHALKYLLNENPQIHVESKPFTQQPRHLVTSTCQCVLSKPLSDNAIKAFDLIPNSVKWTIQDFEDLRRYGWDHAYLPNSILYLDKEQKKIAFASEVPDDLVNKENYPNEEARRKQAEQFFNYLLQKSLSSISSDDPDVKQGIKELKNNALMVQKKEIPLKASQAEQQRIHSMNNLNFTVFELNLSYVDTPVIELGSGGVYTFVGDSHKAPYFYGAHGLNDAVASARACVQCLPEPNTPGTFNKENYEAILNDMVESEEMMLGYENETLPKLKQQSLENVLKRYLSLIQQILDPKSIGDAVIKQIENAPNAFSFHDVKSAIDAFNHLNQQALKQLQQQKPLTQNKQKELLNIINRCENAWALHLKKANPVANPVATPIAFAKNK